jgi:hypothetical protein
VRQPTAGTVSEILTVHPKQYRDAQIIAENFRDGIPVIINLSQMSDADARRLIDFASGLSLGLYGRIERVTSKVFLLSPENVAISGDGTVAQADPESAPFTSSRGVRAPGGIRRRRPSPALHPRAAGETRSRVHPDVQPPVASAGIRSRLRRGRLHLTDPPLRFFRRLIPPLRIGPSPSTSVFR